VSSITGKEPAHWHDAEGRHRMPDPRMTEFYPERWWDSDERAYVTHLQTHEGEKTDPKPRSADSPLVRDLFELLQAKLSECESIRALIVAHRELEASKAALS